MSLFLLGVSYKSAPLPVREALAITPDDVTSCAQALLRERGIDEVVILSTCNRTELYVNAQTDRLAHQALVALCTARLVQSQRSFSESPTWLIENYCYEKRGMEVVSHLFSVVCSLDSMVLGEAQILGQTKRAFEMAELHNTCSEVLSRLFKTALSVGKRARSDTAIGSDCVSMSTSMMHIAREHCSALENASCVVLGAGEMAQLSLRYLLQVPVKTIYVASRHYAHAKQLVDQLKTELRLSGEGTSDVGTLPEETSDADMVGAYAADTETAAIGAQCTDTETAAIGAQCTDTQTPNVQVTEQSSSNQPLATQPLVSVSSVQSTIPTVLQAIDFADRYSYIARSQLVMSMTRASSFVVDAEQLEMARNAQRTAANAAAFDATNPASHLVHPTAGTDANATSDAAHHSFAPASHLVLIDAAIPRDIDPACASLPGVQLFDTQHVQHVVDAGLSARMEAVGAVEKLIEQAQSEFLAWMQERSVTPTIKEMYEKGSVVVDRELKRCIKSFENARGQKLSSDECQLLELYGEAIAKKLLHGPTARLRKEAHTSASFYYTVSARYLFGLDTNPPGSGCPHCAHPTCLEGKGCSRRQNCETLQQVGARSAEGVAR